MTVTAVEPETDSIVAPPLFEEEPADLPIALTSRLTPRRFLHLVLVFAGLALAATLTNSPGIWIADARLEFSTDPGGFLAGHEYLWDQARGLGNTATWYTPVVASYEAVLRLLGADPWMVERLVHAAYLTIAAAGLAALLRVTTPRIGWLHLLAGLIYAFNPYTSQFLVPSGLFLSYALSPWLLALFLRGTRDRHDGWRMAAWFALCIFTVGALNTAALLYALIPIPVAAAYVVFIERSVSLRDAIAWLVRAGTLTLVVSCGALAVLWFQRGDVALNLTTTERPTVVSARSSWAESWRGLGMWLTYFRDSSGQLRPQSAAYFQNPLVVVATYGAPIAAALTLTLSRWRPRLFYAALVGIGTVIMVGVWPTSSPSPFGRLLDWGFESAVFLRGLRTTYKAGAAFSIGVAVLSAYGITALLRARETETTGRLGGRIGRTIAGCCLLALVVVAAFPFWSGNLYNEDDGFEEIPTYWDEALGWINSQPEDGRVLVLPGVFRTRYRWGYVNDNLFHGLMDKPLVSHQSIPPPGTPLAADVILEMDEYLASPGYRPGTIGPILRRLGVRWVLFQNDVDWQATGVQRPSEFDSLRDDPELVRVRAFGDIGENTTSGPDPSAAFLGESSIQPVEIYELSDASDTIRVSSGNPVVVAGAGDAWPQLAQQGYLDSGPVTYTGTASDDELAELLSDGSSVVVTDGSRRRYRQVRTGRMVSSHTLALDEDTPREAFNPFPDTTSESFAVYPDALSIEASRVGRGITPFDPAQRPARAFDGIDRTAWEVAGTGAEGAFLSVDLREETAVESISVLPYGGTADRSVGRIRAELVLADGSAVEGVGRPAEASPESGWIQVELVADDVRQIRLYVEDLEGDPSIPVGISEVAVSDDNDTPLDLREFLRTPQDLETASDRSPRIETLLQTADVSYSFRRNIGTGIGDEETEIRRSFWSPQETVANVQGRLLLTGRTPDETVDRLIGNPIGAYGSSRAEGSTDGWGVNAVDGDPATSWLAPPRTGETLTTRPPPDDLETVEFVVTVSSGTDAGAEEFSRIDTARVTATGSDEPVVVDVEAADPICDDEAPRCTESLLAHLPPDTYDSLELEFTSVSPIAGTFSIRPIAVSEVLFDGTAAESSDPSGGRDCTEAFTIDGRVRSVRLLDTHEDLLDKQTVDFESCEAVELAKGDHSFESGPAWSGAISELVIAAEPTDTISAPEPAPAVDVIERSPTKIILEVTAPEGSHILGPGAHHPGWNATIDGEPLGAAVARDALSAWQVPELDNATVELRFRPQRSYELALAITAAGVAICLYLVSRRRRP